jgi:hypothetical protein
MPISRHGVEVGAIGGLANLLIFQHFMPPVADVQATTQFNTSLEKNEREALVLGTIWTGILTALTRKAETFIIAGSILVAIDFAYKHANAVDPGTGKMASAGVEQQAYSLPDYETSGTG